MWGRRALYGLVLALALLGQLFDVGYLFHFIFFTVLWLPVLALAVSLPAMLSCRAEILPPPGAVRRGSCGEWTLVLRAAAGLPLARAAGRLVVQNRMTGETLSLRLSMGRPLTGGRRCWEVESAHCGLVECRAEKLRVCDCLGLIALPVRPPEAVSLLVSPVPEDPGPLVLPESGGAPLPVPRGKSVSGEDYELRPYRPGDTMRSIHWKMTAKRDELVSREPLEDRRPLPVLTVDHFGSPEELDRALDRLAGYSQTLLKRERPFEVRWVHPTTGAPRRFPVEDEASWTACLRALLTDPAPEAGRSILERHLEAEADVPLWHVHITGEEAARHETN